MEELAKLLSSVGQILWPFIVFVLILLFRRQIKLLLKPGTELAFELWGSKLRIKPTKPPLDKEPLPAVQDSQELPVDYVYLNHSSFLREDLQEEFKARTGVNLLHYDIRVIVDSYYHGALDNIERVEYILHEAYPDPIQVRTHKENKFLLKELANGEYVLLAKVYFRDRSSPVVLQRYITLWKDGPRIE